MVACRQLRAMERTYIYFIPSDGSLLLPGTGAVVDLSYWTYLLKYIHTYHSRFIPEGVAEVSQIFLRDTHVLPKLLTKRII
jgi:hypothetical protein